MRFLDLGAAALIGLTAISTMLLWNPAVPDSAAGVSRLDSNLRGWLLEYLDSRGLVWVQSAPLQSICDSLLAMSNSTYTASVTEDGAGCGWHPSQGAAPVSIRISLGGRELTFLAWSNAAQ